VSEQRAKKPPVNDQTASGPPSVPGLPLLGPPRRQRSGDFFLGGAFALLTR
jgi:hypothetical protein